MMKHNFQIQLPQRSASCVIVETISEVYVNLEFSAYGSFNDEQQIRDWLFPIAYRYEHDQRPLIITGKYGTGTLYTFEDCFFGIMERNDEPIS